MLWFWGDFLTQEMKFSRKDMWTWCIHPLWAYSRHVPSRQHGQQLNASHNNCIIEIELWVELNCERSWVKPDGMVYTRQLPSFQFAPLSSVIEVFSHHHGMRPSNPIAGISVTSWSHLMGEFGSSLWLESGDVEVTGGYTHTQCG